MIHHNQQNIHTVISNKSRIHYLMGMVNDTLQSAIYLQLLLDGNGEWYAVISNISTVCYLMVRVHDTLESARYLKVAI